MKWLFQRLLLKQQVFINIYSRPPLCGFLRNNIQGLCIVLFKELLFLKDEITSFVYVFNTINGMHSFLGGVVFRGLARKRI